MIKILFAVLAFCTFAQGQAEKLYWPAVGAYGASIIADGVTTQQMLREGFHESWNPGLYGRSPTNLRFYAVQGAIAGGVVFASYKLTHSEHKPLKVLGWALLVWEIQGETHAAIHNSLLRGYPR